MLKNHFEAIRGKIYLDKSGSMDSHFRGNFDKEQDIFIVPKCLPTDSSSVARARRVET